jgi:hypothetical protein
MGNLFTDLFSTKPAEDAAKDKIAGINAGMSSANSTLDAGQANADALYGQAYAPFSSLIDSTGRGSTAYGDATGANGAAGLANAKALFTATPGYQSGFDLLTDANDRRAASRGILASGNTIADTTKLATTYADQNYGNYVSRLSPYLNANQSAITGGAAVKGAQAGADLGVAGQKANYGYTGNTAIGNANADKDMAAYSASKNFWGALAGGAQLALGMPPTSWSGMSPVGSSPSYGGGNMWSGDAYGGSSSSPLPGLSAADYGAGY